MNFEKSKQLQARLHQVVPGGCHTYAKGDDQYPELAPGLIERGAGCHVWDVDGNEYIEYGMGNRSVALGHAYPEVIAAAQQEMTRGANFTRPAPIELECAEQFLEMIPSAEMVKFCKDGSYATSTAIRLARAVTGRDYVARCTDHPFFSNQDWFIGTTVLDAGIPEALQQLTLGFRYNDVASVEQLFADHPGQIAALILEPAKYEDPRDNYLQEVRRLCHENGALMILDEMITGFRWHNGGGQAYYGVVPDLCTFGKALANGFSVSALAGKRQYMELGGLDHDQQRVYLLSSTHGAETSSLAAATATMRIYQREPVIETLFTQGEKLRAGAEDVIRRHGLSDFVQIVGKPCCLVFATRDLQGNPSQAYRSLFLQETIRRGVLMTTLIVSYSHSDEDIEKTVEAIDGALGVYGQALEEGAEKFLVGRPSQMVYRRFNQPQTGRDAEVDQAAHPADASIYNSARTSPQ